MTIKPLRDAWPVLIGVTLAVAVLTHDRARSNIATPVQQVGGAAVRPISLIQKGDRVAWIGSSSTKIGVWTKTVEFLLRTRHPATRLEFSRHTTGGGTFQTGLDHLDEWLAESHPTVVFLNYGGNDADAGHPGLATYKERMNACVEKIEATGARVVLVTPQAADVRKSGIAPAAKRTLYAETMLEHGREQGWAVLDVHHPLDLLQRVNQKNDPAYTILKDKIHLTDPAYIGWGYFVYDRLDLPAARSEAVLSWDGAVVSAQRCEVGDVKTGESTLAFHRTDEVLPILPPVALPPRLSVPLEAHSAYLLKVVGLESGSRYEILCEGRSIGVVEAQDLAAGVNLNSLLLDEGGEAPWNELAREIWEGRKLDQIGHTTWRFEVRKR